MQSPPTSLCLTLTYKGKELVAFLSIIRITTAANKGKQQITPSVT